MTTEDEPVTSTIPEHDVMLADLEARRAEEAAIAAVQDAALAAVRAQCDAYRAALAKE
jgi:hypothetical protein